MARQTPNRKAFEQEVKKIERLVKRLSKQGFEIDTFTIPTPKRVTKKQIRLVKQVIPSIKSQVEDIHTHHKDREITLFGNAQLETNSLRLTGEEYIRHPRIADPEKTKWKQAINRLRKEGYIVPDYSPEWGEYNIDELYKRSAYLDRETGEIIPGEEERRRRRSERARRGAETRRRNRAIFLGDYGEIDTPETIPTLEDFLTTRLSDVLNEWIEYGIEHNKRVEGAIYVLTELELKTDKAKQLLQKAFSLMETGGLEFTYLEAYNITQAQNFWSALTQLARDNLDMSEEGYADLVEYEEFTGDGVDEWEVS